MTTRLLRLGAAVAVVALLAGAACSDDDADDAAATETTSTTAREVGGGESATTASSAPAADPATGDPATAATGAETATTAATVSPTPPGKTAALTANLTGEAEVPDPGIAGGTGVATLEITGMEMCYTLNAPIAEKPIVAHIHKGGAGEAGDIVINFEVVFAKAGSAYVAEKCLNKDPALLAGIVANPAGFYVNIHTGEHPKGALRGQLAAS